MVKEGTIKLKIHYGGSMSKVGEGYVYVGDFGSKSVEWKLSEISWERFGSFVKEEKVYAPIALIFYKKVIEKMKDLKYVYDMNNGDMNELRLAGKEAGEIDVYMEHDCSEQRGDVIYRLPSSQHVDVNGGEGEGIKAAMDVNGKDKNNDDDEDDDDDDDDRPREDDEPEQSEDEEELENQEHNMGPEVDEEVLDEGLIANEKNAAADEGDEVVLDAGDGGKDERFKKLFEEGAKIKEAIWNDDEEKKEEEREAEESEQEYGLGDEEYPDTPLESEEEWDTWTTKKKSKEKAKFHGDIDKEPYLWLFQKFSSGLEFKDQLLRYSLRTQHDVKMAKSEANRIAAICCTKKCPWRVFCSIEIPINKWMVKVCHYQHNHEKSSRVSMLKQGVIAGLFREELRRNVGLQAAEIKDAIKARYNIVVPLSKCFRGRRIALDSVIEAQSIQFGKLWEYEAELHRSHKNISTELLTLPVNDVLMFNCFYICFEELRRSWKNFCRPVIGLDGCFLKWELNGDLLAAVGRDADNRMFPIAWAVVRGENKDTWGWFIKKLKEDLELGQGEELTIISDKQKGLVLAISKELPKAEHRMCARHIYANWRKQFTRSEYKNLFWGIAYSYNQGEYDDRMKDMESFDPAAYAALLKQEPEKWCRAFFPPESHCADVHNNLCESFNRTIKIARTKPVISLLEDIRKQAMRRISRRSLKAVKCDTFLTPITMAILEKGRVAKKYCKTNRSSASLYEVEEFAMGYTVDFLAQQCACRRWDLTGIPCKHALCVLDDNQESPVKYVAEYYTADAMRNTYANNIKPVNGEKLWKKIDKPPVGIPEYRKPRGRPKNRDRKKEPFEDLKNKGKSTRHGRVPHCSQCGEAGHIKSGCKNEKVVVEGPKRRRGRPSKVPPTIKPPTQTKRKKKNLSTVSTSTVMPPGESTSSVPTTLTAPAPPISSTQTNQPIKKRKRGKALKITKAESIPKGVGIFWSPYTDRVFDVFPNRTHDRSTNPSEPSSEPHK